MMAVGDGANDVNMIIEADVGVGIQGKEGSQASRTANYSIAKFKFLQPLIFVHGREGIRRSSYIVNYTFYKNVLVICV